MSAKILFIDIETAPETAYIWKRFKETIGQSQIKEPSYILCISWMWLGENIPKVVSIYNNRSWKRGIRNDDRQIVAVAHKLLNEADIVVGHNVKSFDIATLNSRFLVYGMLPPSPYKICDTLDMVKRKFRFPSNTLESLSQILGIDVKEKQSFSLWKGCLDGLNESWNKLTTYCMNDVNVVAQLYEKLIPWHDQHPNVSLYVENDKSEIICPKCGSSHIVKRGVQHTIVNSYTRFCCKDCGGWSRGRYPLKRNNEIVTNAVVN